MVAMPIALSRPRIGPMQHAMHASAPTPRSRPMPPRLVMGSAVIGGSEQRDEGGVCVGRCGDFEADAAVVDGDGEVEESAAVLFGGGELDEEDDDGLGQREHREHE